VPGEQARARPAAARRLPADHGAAGDKVILLHGVTRLQAGDRIVALVAPERVGEVGRVFRPTAAH